MSRRILIDPRFRVPYYSYVLQGLNELGWKYSFRKLASNTNGLLYLVDGDRRVVVDADDNAKVDEPGYDWCDVFGKTNVEPGALDLMPKIRPTGPLFSIRLWPMKVAYAHAVRLGVAGAPFVSSLKGVRYQGKTRVGIAEYPQSCAESDFVFHRSRAWTGRHASTNEPRERFIEAIRQLGLAGETLLADDRIPLATYLQLTARSSVVFNCPAVHQCLGWKLGEFLMMGKAIISTDLHREVPEELVHGEQVHFVADSVDSIREAVELVNRDVEYRTHLERGARSWYERNLTPQRVASRILD